MIVKQLADGWKVETWWDRYSRNWITQLLEMPSAIKSVMPR
jgi:hypothetical protein